MKIHQVLSGEPILLDTRGLHSWACCECGFVHAVTLQKKGEYGVEVTMYRDDYMTDQKRKASRYALKKVSQKFRGK
jgi:hypothetical protein